MKTLIKEAVVITFVTLFFTAGVTADSKEFLKLKLFEELQIFFDYLHFGIVIVLGAFALMFVQDELTPKKCIKSFSSSIFAGTIALFLGMEYSLNKNLLIVFVGLSSWGGERSLKIIEAVFKAKVDRKGEKIG